MVTKLHLSCFVLISQIWLGFAQNEPPAVNGSFRAMGEMVENTDDGITVQVSFEENYNNETGDAAFTVTEFGMNVTFIENYLSNQTMKYIDGTKCEIETPKDWSEVDAPPSLIGYKSFDGRIRFSLRQLFNIDSNYLVGPRGAPDSFREIPAKKWTYEMDKIEKDGNKSQVVIYAYWSDGSYNTTSSNNVVPLGYLITKTIEYGSTIDKMKVIEQFVSVMAFIDGAINKEVFKAREGINCTGRDHPYKFPDIPKVDAVSFRSEYALPGYQQVKAISVWYDPKKLMLRMDLDRVEGQNPIYLHTGRKFTSMQTSMRMATTFQLDYYQGALTCKVYPVEEYEYDSQDLINIKTTAWSMDSFFGKNVTNYVYIGKTHKRNMPCHVFQGTRKDWPEPAADVTSLWEWCFAMKLAHNDDEVNFREGEIPVISVKINITESKDTLKFPVGYSMVHHLYDFMKEDSAILDATVFDVSPCFADNETRYLQFSVDVEIDDNNIHIMENATSDLDFLRLWKEAICAKSDLPLYTLRVANVKSTVYEKKLYVSFKLLDRHRHLPDAIRDEQRTLKEAFEYLQDAVNKDELSIRYKPSEKSEFMVLKAAKNSLVDQIDKNFEPHVPSPRPVTVPVHTIPTFDFSLIVDTTTTPAPDDKGNLKMSGYGSGTVAGVSITMLLVGITIGAGGTFYKYKGIPTCKW